MYIFVTQKHPFLRSSSHNNFNSMPLIFPTPENGIQNQQTCKQFTYFICSAQLIANKMLTQKLNEQERYFKFPWHVRTVFKMWPKRNVGLHI